MSEEMPEYDGRKMPLLKAWAIFIWTFLIPVTLAILMLASLGLMVVLLFPGNSIGEMLWGVICLICGLVFGFLFQWRQAIEAKRPDVDTPITRRMILAAGRETYSRMKWLILRRAPKEG